MGVQVLFLVFAVELVVKFPEHEEFITRLWVRNAGGLA